MNLTAFLERGSTKKDIQRDILAVFKLATELQLVLLPVHLRREDPRIQMADTGSKWTEDTDDWGIDEESFQRVKEWFPMRLDVDLFADTNNARVGQFFSRYDCPNSQGVDGFSMQWAGLQAWACPPVSKVTETVKKILHSPGLRGILIVPRWSSAAFWPFLCPDGKHLTECFAAAKEFRPFVVNNEEAQNQRFSLMRGWTAFAFLALEITSSGRGRLAPGRVRMPGV